MVLTCVVGGCKNTNKNVTLHEWPKNTKKHKAWIRFVKRTKPGWGGPPKSSYRISVCSDHFTEDQFINKRKFDEGFASSLRLVHDAVPTIQSPASVKKGKDGEHSQNSSYKQRSAFRKREVERIIEEYEKEEASRLAKPASPKMVYLVGNQQSAPSPIQSNLATTTAINCLPTESTGVSPSSLLEVPTVTISQPDHDSNKEPVPKVAANTTESILNSGVKIVTGDGVLIDEDDDSNMPSDVASLQCLLREKDRTIQHMVKQIQGLEEEVVGLRHKLSELQYEENADYFLKHFKLDGAAVGPLTKINVTETKPTKKGKQAGGRKAGRKFPKTVSTPPTKPATPPTKAFSAKTVQGVDPTVPNVKRIRVINLPPGWKPTSAAASNPSISSLLAQNSPSASKSPLMEVGAEIHNYSVEELLLNCSDVSSKNVSNAGELAKQIKNDDKIKHQCDDQGRLENILMTELENIMIPDIPSTTDSVASQESQSDLPHQGSSSNSSHYNAPTQLGLETRPKGTQESQSDLNQGFSSNSSDFNAPIQLGLKTTPKSKASKSLGGSHFCSAVGCARYQVKMPDLSFFRFPKDPVRCQQWVTNCGRKDTQECDADYLYKNCRLCAEHFEDGQFMNASTKNRLVWNAVPTVFTSGVNETPPKESASKRPVSTRTMKSDKKQKT